jgi:hypothetical protein
MHRYDFNLFADYCQFYLQDEPAIGDLSECWSQEAADRLLAVGPGVVGVGTLSAGIVPVSVELLEASPPDDFAPFDQVNECTLVVAQGPLVAAGCTDYFPDVLRIPAQPGTYRVRVSYVLGPGSEERYRLQMWPSPAIEPLVVKARAAYNSFKPNPLRGSA